MVSFFTTPTSAKKRKRAEGSKSTKASGREKKKRTEDDEISSDEEDETRQKPLDGSEDEQDEFADETVADKRRRLALQYLENTKAEIEEAGFDAEEIDRELIAQRLKESVAEDKGLIYRHLADHLSFSTAPHSFFRADTKSTTGITACYPYIYTASKDRHIIKWAIPHPPSPAVKPKQVLHTRCISKKNDQNYEGGHVDEIIAMAISHDGKFLATGGKDNRIVVWDPETLKPLKIFKQHRSPVMGLAFRRNTHQMYSCSADRTVKSFSLDELAYMETLFGHQDEVVGITALAGERCVTVGARDRTARLWKIVDETQLVFRGGGEGSKKRAPTGAEEHFTEGSMDCVSMIDEEHFVTGSDNGSISLWTINKKKPIYTYPVAHGKPDPLQSTSYTAESSVNESTFPPPPPQPRPITALAAVPYSDTFFSGSYDGYVRVWKVSADKKRIEAVGGLGVPEEDEPSYSIVAEGECEGEGKEKRKEVDTVGSLPSPAPTPHTNPTTPSPDPRTRGVINAISVFETSEKRNILEGAAAVAGELCVAVALGKEMRLGRWLTVPGKNGAMLFRVRGKAGDGMGKKTENRETDDGIVGMRGNARGLR
ncbi:WD40-repeat-containing domain protein [Kalaharituber pfeilii]|nr:WD40-repeat-containing domain protein [Kalaharituber pfeilii]